MKERWEGSTSFIGKHNWLIPSAVFLMTLLIFFLLLFHWKASLAASAQILFSGSLVVTSVLLFTTQRAFNERDDLALASVRRPYYKVTESNLSVNITFEVTNRAPMAARLSEVHIENSILSNEFWEIQWGWGSEATGGPRDLEPPVLFKPHETIGIWLTASIKSEETLKEAKAIKQLKWCFVYQIGNYKKKSTRYTQDVK